MNLLNFLAVLTELPQDIQGFWDMDILGYTTVGAVATFIGGFVYTLIRAKIQRNAVNKGLTNVATNDELHYEKFVEYKAKAELELKEMRDDMVRLAETSVRKEAQEMANKYRNRINEQKAKEFAEKAIPVVQEVIEKVKKRFR